MSKFRLSLSFVASLFVGCDSDSDSESDTTATDSEQTSGTSTDADSTSTGGTTEPESSTTTGASTDATSSGEASGSSSGGDLVLADVNVTVNYDGALQGRIIVAALTTWPPEGPPLASIGEDEPTFPWSGTLLALEPGEYFMFAMVDVGNDSPTMPGDEDPNTVNEMKLIVEDAGPYSVEIDLQDPE